MAAGVHCADGVEVGRPGSNVRVCVRRAGQGVPADLLPAVDAVPNPQLIAHSVRYRCPTQFYPALSRLRRQGRHSQSGRRDRRDSGHVVRPRAFLVVGVHCAHCVEVGRACNDIRVCVRRAGQGVPADLLPFVDAVPRPQLIARCARHLRPTQVHPALASLCGQRRRRKR